MGRWGAVAGLLRFARGDERRQRLVGQGHALALAVGAVLGWLAGRRGAIPPVRATGAAENLVRSEPPTRAPDQPASPEPASP